MSPTAPAEVIVRLVPIPAAVPRPASVLAAHRIGHQLARRAARTAARELIAEHFGCPANQQRWHRSAHGRPLLTVPAGVHVSMSHASGVAGEGGVAAATASVSGPVGVDVETLRPLADADSVALAAFAPAERDALDQLEGTERHLMFLRFWTRKEAVLKALGTGLSGGLGSVVTTATGVLLRLPDGGGRPEGWSVIDLTPGGGLVAAVAVRTPGPVVVRAAAHPPPGANPPGSSPGGGRGRSGRW